MIDQLRFCRPGLRAVEWPRVPLTGPCLWPAGGPAKHRVRGKHAVAGTLFLGNRSRRDESSLRAAYELGRRAVVHPVGLLNLVQVHHKVLMEVLDTARTAEERQDLCDTGAAFLVEAFTNFHIAQRGYWEKAWIARKRSTTRRGTFPTH